MAYDCSSEDYLVHRLITRLTVYEVSNPVDVFDYVLRDCHTRFLEALKRVLTHLDSDQINYRFEFMFGLVSHATTLRAKLAVNGEGFHGIVDSTRLLPELLTSIVAVFMAE
jgi:Tetracyclin repressor-like, C-terminal domain